MSAAEQREEPATDSPEAWAERWSIELAAAQDELQGWHKSGENIVKLFLDEREDETKRKETRWNLFSANIQTQRALMYGRLPQVNVDRRFADAEDDEARVAGEMLERLLNCQIEEPDDTYAEALGQALDDRQLPGLGVVRMRYAVETEDVAAKEAMLGSDGKVLADAVPAGERKASERVATDYVHWRDFLWSPARVWSEVRWVAFRAEMSRKDLEARFGAEVAATVPMGAARSGRSEDDARKATPWARAEVWEIWDKESRRVFWWVSGLGAVLDMQEDELGLKRFFPCPRPLAANVTTMKWKPRPDYKMAEDLYSEINEVSTRITKLQEAVVVRGVYDKSSGDLQKLLNNTMANTLTPVENWAMFAEKGGIKGQIDWMPMDQVVNALGFLRDYRRELMDALYQITGMSDIMRGQASDVGATATEQSIKAKFGSVRMQALQDEFARFASEAQQIKAEIIANLFDAETIIRESNIEHTPDAPLAQAAAALVKSKVGNYRIEVKSEAVSLQDFAALRSERSEVVGTLATFMQAAAPLAQTMPGSMPHLIRMMQWAVAGLRGAASIEGVLDQAAAEAEKAQQQAAANPQQQPPDPKLLQQQMKGQQDIAKVEADKQAKLQLIQAETESAASQERTQMEMNTLEAARKAQISVQVRAMQPTAPGGNGRPT